MFGLNLPKEVSPRPVMTAKKRDYRKEYDEYHGTTAQKKRRADRNRARRQAEKSGRVRKGDGKELDHVGSHRTGRLKNVATRVTSRHANRIRQPSRS
jgi:hypothetical protein